MPPRLRFQTNTKDVEYTNLDKLAAVAAEWLRPSLQGIAASRLDKMEGVAAANSWVVKYFPVKPDYSIVNDLGFLIAPAAACAIRPALANIINRAGIPDSSIPEFANGIADAAAKEAEEKGKITLFGILEIEQSDIDVLKDLLDKNLPCGQQSGYTVIK